ncbi:redox-sensitive transcriptional activator SoxR [Kaistia dalseonensis]|uniref:MerR family redox-sensitive transcriptional activator SoxR n=1 Tax=Kaistia dalseonensis TaxID=410840 RepID=A0ABU0HDG2_9HYPH|nr:redox-sensitive transcriptional activator SoxR [Kaistia dalseonensis]MCX5497354.1 redox-sensitive transcriptional activator SoxR [Kaistia dalseonensis]MDQ0439992.1 MerR family redox-sensitive transcriptional activator SoxR [Kaistia dalseonensis]
MARELTVGQLAARAGVAVSALHFYESKGLIRSNRTLGNQRRYAGDVLRRVSIIRIAQELGISLAEVGAAFEQLPKDRSPSREDWELMSSRWAEKLDARIALLQRLRNGLADCIGCGCLSIDRCSLLNWNDRQAAEGPGPRRLIAGP